MSIRNLTIIALRQVYLRLLDYNIDRVNEHIFPQLPNDLIDTLNLALNPTINWSDPESLIVRLWDLDYIFDSVCIYEPNCGVVKYFLDHEWDIKGDVFIKAAEQCNINILKMTIHQVSNTVKQHAVTQVLKSNKITVAKYLLNNIKETDLIDYDHIYDHASIYGYIDVIRFIDRCTSISFNAIKSSVYNSILSGRVDIMKYFLDYLSNDDKHNILQHDNYFIIKRVLMVINYEVIDNYRNRLINIIELIKNELKDILTADMIDEINYSINVYVV